MTDATVATVMRPPVTTVAKNDHAAAGAYLMKRSGATALVVLEGMTSKPIGIITETDIVQAVADGTDLNDVRIGQLMTTGLTVINPTTTIDDAAEAMLAGHFRHLPVVDGTALVGMVDIQDVSRALLGRKDGPGRP